MVYMPCLGQNIIKRTSKSTAWLHRVAIYVSRALQRCADIDQTIPPSCCAPSSKNKNSLYRAVKKSQKIQISAGFEPARFWTFSRCSTTGAFELEGIHRLIPINVTASVYEGFIAVFRLFCSFFRQFLFSPRPWRTTGWDTLQSLCGHSTSLQEMR